MALIDGAGRRHQIGDGSSMVFQMQLARRLDALPLTRDYMAEAARPAAPRAAMSGAAAG